MRKAIGHLITGTWMFCLLPALLLASCGSEAADDPDVPGGEATLNIGFRIPSRTTAEDNELYENGETYENYIDIAGENYRIYFFDEYSKYIARFEPSGFITADGSDYRQYNVLGKAPDALAKHSTFKIVVLANWPKYPEDWKDDSEDNGVNQSLEEGVTTIADICNADWAQYSCLTDGKDAPTAVALNPFAADPNKRKLMPFYGVHKYDGVTFEPGVATILSEPVTLLRAMAKVEVILETDDDISITDVKIFGYNKRGYCAPSNVFSQSDYGQGNNWETDYLSELHLSGGKNDPDASTRSLSLLQESQKDSKTKEKWIAYLPEYKNKGVGDEFACLNLKFNIQTEGDTPHTIYFANYSNGQTDNDNDKNRLNIERNNIYRFTVTCTSYNFNLQLTVSNWEGLYENIFEYGDIQIYSPVSPWEDEKNNNIEF